MCIRDRPSGTKTGSATEQTAQTEADTAAEEKTYTADELKDAIKAVSYTHLDVYKRQHIHLMIQMVMEILSVREIMMTR